jgi:hypothetical protein
MPQSQNPRNIFVYDANVPEGTQRVLLAGCMQLGQTTAGQLYDCLEICFAEPRPSQFRVMGYNGNILVRDIAIVLAGNYYVVTLRYCQTCVCADK